MSDEYVRGIIYKLYDDEGHFYFGSTAKTINERYMQHKYRSNKNIKQKVYNVFTHERFCKGEIKIQVIEEVVVKCIKDLCKIEDMYIKNEMTNLLCLNTVRSYNPNTKQEYADRNKENKKEQQRLYRESHREEINERIRKYHKTHKEEATQYREKIKGKFYTCECGKTINWRSIPLHKKSSFHMNYISHLED